MWLESVLKQETQRRTHDWRTASFPTQCLEERSSNHDKRNSLETDLSWWWSQPLLSHLKIRQVKAPASLIKFLTQLMHRRPPKKQLVRMQTNIPLSSIRRRRQRTVDTSVIGWTSSQRCPPCSETLLERRWRKMEVAVCPKVHILSSWSCSWSG